RRCGGICCRVMRSRLFTLMLLVCSLAAAATVYKWVDEHGVVHYSDQPHPNAQKMSVQSAQTYKAGDQTLTNVDSLTVIVRTDPALRPGDQIFLMLDGQPLNGGAATGSPFTLTSVDRGTHTLQALVRDSDGGLMCQTPGVTYHAHQPSV